MPSLENFSFRKLDTVGAADAADDSKFLDTCFVDTGVMNALLDCRDPHRIVLGRTGTGKTALLIRLAEKSPNAIRIKPEGLSLPYIVNSNILTFMHKLGVKLDLFFKLLWRHVLVVEILKKKFNVRGSADKRAMVERIIGSIKDNHRHKAAITYLEKYGASFWEDTDRRVREITDQVTNNLKAAAGLDKAPASASFEFERNWTTEQKQEVVHRAQSVINQVQIRELTDIIRLTNDILDDEYDTYHIVIDQLDENWVDEDLRLRLIRALIEAVKDMREIRHAKVVVALRFDLLQRVFRLPREGGFQEEKYESSFLRMSWTRDQLKEVLDKRINELIRHRYTKRAVTYLDVLNSRVDGQEAIDYLIDRTLMRPRDVIQFFNTCVRFAEGKATISSEAMKSAAGEFSRERIKAVLREWEDDYPSLPLFVDKLKSGKASFAVDSLASQQFSEACLAAAASGKLGGDELSTFAAAVAYDDRPLTEFATSLAYVLYRVGIAGLKVEKFEPARYAYDDQRAISSAEVRLDTTVHIHKAFWRALGINPEA